MYRKFFQNRDFMKMTAANVINTFGDSVDGVAFTWLTYEISQSASLSEMCIRDRSDTEFRKKRTQGCAERGTALFFYTCISKNIQNCHFEIVKMSEIGKK